MVWYPWQRVKTNGKEKNHMGIRVLFLLLCIFLITFIIRHFLYKRQVQQKPASAVVFVKKCAYCNTHVPRHEMLTYRGKGYCCKEHVELDHVAKQ